MDIDRFIPFLNQTQTEEGKGISAVKLSLQTAGIIIIVVMIATCCCTLYLRNKLMNLVYKITRKKSRESTLLPVDVEKGKGDSKSSLKKLQKTEIKTPKHDVTRTVTQSVMTTTSSVQAEPSTTICCRCFKKKKKNRKKQRTVDDEIPCIRQLVHWNESPTEGLGQAHEVLIHRLRQLNRNDLADWLGKSTFKQLRKDIERIMDRPFDELGEQETERSYALTINPVETPEDDDFWSKLDIVLLAITLGLLGTLLTLVGYIIFHIIKIRLRKAKYTYKRKMKQNATTDKLSKLSEEEK
ncbi:hypothetical protein KPH14_011697 [Odynerus spinipes]|uniref:Uncharacterized protein n=1 Tax=Odynerus spinipes TaxID=1348599 RepID=A0AAD9VUJ7_9HYME|nr:hypothetical protein KPH14_011697 [Odynerus spinipes]